MALIVFDCLFEQRRQRVVINAMHVAACQPLTKNRTTITLRNGRTFIALVSHARANHAWRAGRAWRDGRGLLVLE
jgi:hypothetical protein